MCAGCGGSYAYGLGQQSKSGRKDGRAHWARDDDGRWWCGGSERCEAGGEEPAMYSEQSMLDRDVSLQVTELVQDFVGLGASWEGTAQAVRKAAEDL